MANDSKMKITIFIVLLASVFLSCNKDGKEPVLVPDPSLSEVIDQRRSIELASEVRISDGLSVDVRFDESLDTFLIVRTHGNLQEFIKTVLIDGVLHIYREPAELSGTETIEIRMNRIFFNKVTLDTQAEIHFLDSLQSPLFTAELHNASMDGLISTDTLDMNLRQDAYFHAIGSTHVLKAQAESGCSIHGDNFDIDKTQIDITSNSSAVLKSHLELFGTVFDNSRLIYLVEPDSLNLVVSANSEAYKL